MHAVPLLATKDDSGEYHFEPDSDIWDDSRDEFVFSKDRHGMRRHDYHLLEFVLNDRTGDDLRFPESPHDAMWVMAVDDPEHRACPDMHTVSNYDIMEPVCVCDDQKRLIVRNDNPRKENWSFTLNFVRPGEDQSDPSRFVSWDPGGLNQNGGNAQ